MNTTKTATYSLCLSMLITSVSWGQNVKREPGEPSSIQTNELQTRFENKTNSVKQTSEGPEITYSVPESVENLTERFVWYHSEKKTIKGYRVELFSASGANSRNRANLIKNNVENGFENLPAYVVWKYPNFEVECGDFRTKLEAEAALLLLKEDYPRAFVKGPDIDIFPPPTDPALSEIKVIEQEPIQRIK